MKINKKGRDSHMLPLGLLSAGEKAEVMEIGEVSCCGAGSPAINKSDRSGHICRMEDMGLRVGKEVEMLNSEGKGVMLIRIDESRIAIARGMAMGQLGRLREGLWIWAYWWARQ